MLSTRQASWFIHKIQMHFYPKKFDVARFEEWATENLGTYEVNNLVTGDDDFIIGQLDHLGYKLFDCEYDHVGCRGKAEQDGACTNCGAKEFK